MILIKRAVPLLLVLMVVLVASIPVSAAEPYTQFLPSTTLDGSWSSDDNFFYAEFALPSDLYTFPGVCDSSTPVTFVVNGVSYLLYVQDVDLTDQIVFGNASLFDSDYPSSSEDFAIIVGNDSLCFFISSVNYTPLTLEIYTGDKPAEFDRGLLDDFGTVAGAVMGFVATIADTIVSTPLLLLTVGFFFGGGCVGIFGRILSKN